MSPCLLIQENVFHLSKIEWKKTADSHVTSEEGSSHSNYFLSTPSRPDFLSLSFLLQVSKVKEQGQSGSGMLGRRKVEAAASFSSKTTHTHIVGRNVRSFTFSLPGVETYKYRRNHCFCLYRERALITKGFVRLRGCWDCAVMRRCPFCSWCV